MKNYLKIIGLLLSLFLLLHFSNCLALKKNYCSGRYCFTTKLGVSDYGDQVFYYTKRKTTILEQSRKQLSWCGRIMGKEGDQLHVADGHVYIDGKIIDDDINLKFSYQISARDYNANKDLVRNFFKNAWNFMMSCDLVETEQKEALYGIITLKESEFEQLTLEDSFEKIDRFSFRDSPQNPAFLLFTDTTWTSLDYGPIIIPKGHYFLLGDYRPGLVDSQTDGFYKESNILNRVLFQLPF